MDALLLLIAVNFLSVPFLQEAEAQGRRLRRFPGVACILRLAHVRGTGWFKPFCLLSFFLFSSVLAVTRTPGDVDGLTLLVRTAIMQALLWTVVVLGVRRQARQPDGPAASAAPAGPGAGACVLHQS